MSLKIKGKKLIKSLIFVQFAIMFALFFAVYFACFQMPFFNVIKYGVFQIVAILVPGMVLAGRIKQKLPVLTRVCFAYAIGYSLNILEYLLVELTNRLLPHLVLVLVIFSISVLYMVNKKEVYMKLYLKDASDKSSLIFLSFFIVIFMINLFAFALRYRELSCFTHDMNWWMHNSVALKLKFEPTYLIMSGPTLFYHYFSSMQVAFCSLVTGIDIYALSVPFYAITKTIIVVGAADFLLESLGVEKGEKIWGYLLILCTTGNETLSIVTYFSHILLMPFGFDVGYATGMYFVALMIMQLKKTEFDINLFVTSILFWCVCVGAKAPLAAVLLMIPGLICVYWLVKKQYKLSFGYGLSILSIFLAVSIVFVGLLSVAGGTSGSYYLATHSYSDLCMFNGKTYPLVVAVLARWFWLNPALACLFLISLIDIVILIRKKIKIQINTIVILVVFGVTYLWGIGLWRIVLADGNSEMYYAMAAFIPSYVLVAVVYQLSQKAGLYKSRIGKLKKVIMQGAICLGIYFFMFSAYEGDSGIITSIRHIKNIEKIASKDYSSISALGWLRKCSDLDSLVASDSAVMTDNSIYYYCGILSERQQYLEGWHMLRFGDEDMQNEIAHRKELLKELYNGNVNCVKQLREEGVDYIVQTVDISPDFVYDTEQLELVAQSARVNVYKIKEVAGEKNSLE